MQSYIICNRLFFAGSRKKKSYILISPIESCKNLGGILEVMIIYLPNMALQVGLLLTENTAYGTSTKQWMVNFSSRRK